MKRGRVWPVVPIAAKSVAGRSSCDRRLPVHIAAWHTARGTRTYLSLPAVVRQLLPTPGQGELGHEFSVIDRNTVGRHGALEAPTLA